MMIHIVAKHVIRGVAYHDHAFEIVSIHTSRKEAKWLADEKNRRSRFGRGGRYFYDVVSKRVEVEKVNG